MERKVYIYEGPVYHFNQIVTEKWYAKTTAVNSKKAISNLTHRFKIKNGLNPNADIRLSTTFLHN